MTTHTFKPDGRLHSESKNLRGVLDNARRRGVKRITLTRITNSRYDMLCKMTYCDDFYSLYNFADEGICRDFHLKRWPSVTMKG
jgi:hypothetical protein